MRLDEFVAQLEAAGWRPQLDAQHQRITELWRAEYPGAASYLDALEETRTELASLRAERDALRKALQDVKALAEFWINCEDTRGKSESEYRTWLALGHHSNALQNARNVLKDGA